MVEFWNGFLRRIALNGLNGVWRVSSNATALTRMVLVLVARCAGGYIFGMSIQRLFKTFAHTVKREQSPLRDWSVVFVFV